MKACKVTITTTVDGQENTIVRDGEMSLLPQSVSLSYREENAVVSLVLKGENAEIVRQGDYTLRLKLARGETCEGEIGIGGAGGSIRTFAHRVAYSVTRDSLLLALHYDLIIGGEVQEMKLRVLSRFYGGDA